MPRDLQQHSIEKLEDLFRSSLDNPRIIAEIIAELNHRNTQRSRTLMDSAVRRRNHLEMISNYEVTEMPAETLTAQSELGERGFTEEFDTFDAVEQSRLRDLYEKLRLKLLDLTLRNRMLNYTISARAKNQLQIIDAVPEVVYAHLVDDVAMQVCALPEPDLHPKDERTDEFVSALQHAKVADVEYVDKLEKLTASETDDDIAAQRLERELRDRLRVQLGMTPRPRRSEINRLDHARSSGIEPNVDLQPLDLSQRHTGQSLQTLKYPDELEATMARISEQARLAEQEAGLSTLFLAMGFLEWYESDDSDRPLSAPLLLLPVNIVVQKILGKPTYSIKASEEFAETNVSLDMFLKQKFGRTLPELDDENEDEPIETYLKAVEGSIEGLKRWNVRRRLVLGHFAFSRIAIYEDTNPERWPAHPASHSLVGALLSGHEAGDLDENSFSSPSDYDIEDIEIEQLAPILIQDADASQHSALIDVMKGKNLVIQGPPGTGKSQTITNVIANALAAKKSVLFLSEKQAALEVVKRRLGRAGLDDFCLELHSDKASPRQVIEAIDQRLRLERDGGVQHAQDALWQEAREQIKGYLNDLHAPSEDGETVFTMIWRALKLQADDPDTLSVMRGVQLPFELVSDTDRVAEVSGRLQEYAMSSQLFIDNYGPLHASPWTRTPINELAPYDYDQLTTDLRELLACAEALHGLPSQMSEYGVDDLDNVRKTAAAGGSMPETPNADLQLSLGTSDIDTLEGATDAQAAVLETVRDLKGYPRNIGVSTELLPLAKTLAETVPDNDSNVTPNEFVRNAETLIRQNDRVLDLLSRMEPAFQTLGIGRTDGTGLARVACRLCAVARSLDEDQRSWINVKVAEPSAAIMLSGEHKAILAEEADLLSLFPKGGRGKWPTMADLQQTASSLERKGISKFISTLSGKRAAAIFTLATLGHATDDPLALERIHRVIKHVERTNKFNSTANSAAIGAIWNGLDTPFPLIDLALHVKEQVNQIESPTGGYGIKDRFFALSPENIGLLASFSDQAEELLASTGLTEEKADSVKHLMVLIQRQNDALEKALSVDPDRKLELATVPIKTLGVIATLNERLDAAKAVVADSGIGEIITANGSTDHGIGKLRAVVEWMRWVDGSDLPQRLREQLLGQVETAAEAVRWIDETYNASLVAFETAASRCGQYGFEDFLELPLEDLIEHTSALIAHEPELNDWQSLNRRRAFLQEAGLEELLRLADENDLEPDKLTTIFDALHARHRVVAGRRTSALLRTFTGADLETKRRVFAERDLRKIQGDRQYVKARLLERIAPSGNRRGPVKSFTDMSLIRHEIPKQRRFTPVRSLLSRAGTAVQTLKPCFMMSPLSLAKFLPSMALTFDVVVIDEASQMRPEDALGAMLRAKQIVVVGDRHQLPPSSFFDRAESGSDDEDEDQIDDESILERCQKVFNEVRGLKWHYRSRCESLIRFSNEAFYKNELITFPAAKPGAFSVDLMRVNGTYQARRNLVEAERISEEAVELMRHFANAEERNMPTLGIVAVNVDQRDLIAETLRRLAADDALVEEYMAKAEAKGEPLFVKNLENVQGDERDFIFISMTYGPAPGQTKPHQRFGPINSIHGHRRLNVLFSRARVRLALFTSLGSEHVTPTETSNKGVHVLKQYLEYAETKGRSAVESIGHEADSDFEIEVARRLRMRGYNIELQVGVTGYKIDIGVRHPDAQHTFIAGIECDGARYHSSKSARDRDRLREEVLGGLGWKLIRVWSTDWFDNPERETTKLVTKLEALRQADRTTYEDYSFSTTYVPPAILPDVSLEEEPPAVEAASPETEVTAPQLALDVFSQPEDGLALLASRQPLSEAQVTLVLRAFRDTVIAARMEAWEPHRSILRDGMIETFIRQRIIDPEEWFQRVPQYLRSGTNPMEKNLFLEQICEIIDRMD